MPVSPEISILSKERIDRIIKRIAYQVVEDNSSKLPITIFGVDERGFGLANLLKTYLSEIYGNDIPVIRLPVKREGKIPDISVANGSFCILFDDVIFSGITMFNAMSQILDQIKPATLKVAALVDRGHRQYPIEAHYIGIVSPTKLNEHVQCNFDDNDLPMSVVLQRA